MALRLPLRSLISTSVEKQFASTTLFPERRRAPEPAPRVAGKEDLAAGDILIVEDDLLTRRLLERILENAGFSPKSVGSMHDALGEIARHAYDLVLLDVLLPDGDGFACCQRMRLRYHMPIIMISTLTSVADRITALGIGADDFIVKPFDAGEIVARIKAHLRRVREFSEDDEAAVIRVGPLVIDPARQDAIIDGVPACVTQTEYRLLRLLGLRAGRAVSADFIINELWADDELAHNKLAVYMRRLRKKIEDDPDRPQILLTVRGFGYRMVAPEAAAAIDETHAV